MDLLALSSGKSPEVGSHSGRRFVMIGGFLGAGKTTAVLQCARWVTERKGWKVALITNDQAQGLVDTALASGGRFAVTEIGGGCFCCRSESLVKAMESFSERVQPQVLIGEPVGSCTDLVSTVLEPLRTIYKTDYELAPLSVVVDPFRAERIVKASGTVSAVFSEDVSYIYRKQLEEAEIIVINKCDVFPDNRLIALRNEIKQQFPRAEVLCVAARTGWGLEEWWEHLLTRTHRPERLMEVDYKTYAEGEARLGWVNGEYDVRAMAPLRRPSKETADINGNKLLETVARAIKASFETEGIEVAHLKISLKGAAAEHPTSNTQHPLSNEEDGALAAIQWVRVGSEPEFTLRLEKLITRGHMLLNLRAEAKPEVLTAIVDQALATVKSQALLHKRVYAAFKPAPPKPTHRVEELPTAESVQPEPASTLFLP